MNWRETNPRPRRRKILRRTCCALFAANHGAAVAETLSVFDQLNLLFPRIAFAAVAVIVLCVAVDFGLTAAGMPGLGHGLSQISAQWLLTPDEFQL